MSPAGYVLLAMVALFFLYLLPSVIRSRQVVVDSRVEDRFSGELRILATAGHPPARARRDSTIRGYVHRPRNETPEAPMDTPAAHHERLVATDARRAAAARAARAAAASRRAAAAKRRLVLTLLLLGASAVTWVLVATVSLAPVAAIVPTAALAGVVVLGRRASAQAAEAESRWREDSSRQDGQDRPDRQAPRADIDRSDRSARTAGTDRSAGIDRSARAATTPEIRSSRAAETQVASRLRIDVDPSALPPEEPPTRKHQGPELAEGEGWTPVPVPVPTYTLKPAAPRRE
ncbi:MAG: hypothetical protein JJE50_08240, partial [Actinomycetales bacterium]|nr:hypothetical protein [Actinomycetales bacterium]